MGMRVCARWLLSIGHCRYFGLRNGNRVRGVTSAKVTAPCKKQVATTVLRPPRPLNVCGSPAYFASHRRVKTSTNRVFRTKVTQNYQSACTADIYSPTGLGEMLTLPQRSVQHDDC